MASIMTAAALEHRTLEELRTLMRKVERDLALSAPGSAERRNALASLENLSRAIARRRAHHPPGA